MSGTGLKYIVFSDDTFSIFPKTVGHNEMRTMGKTPVSAGFVTLEIDNNGCLPALVPSCHGESITLGLKSNPEHDNNVISIGYRIGF